MTLAFNDRVQETTVTSGTGTITLDGAVVGFQPFSSLGNGNTTYYCIFGAIDWEVGQGTYNADTLSRDTVFSSSNNGLLVNFSSEIKNVFVDLPASKAVINTGATTDNAIVRFDGATGSLVQRSQVLIDDSGNATGINAVTFDTTPTTPPIGEGSLYWDNEDSIQTLNLIMAGGNATQHIGEETYYRVRASSAITNGQVVMFTGTLGASGGLTAAPATGLTASTASYVLGVATQDIPLNDWGYVTHFGEVKQIDTSAFSDGAILYYDPTVAGGLTATLPSAPNAKIQVCAVVHSSATTGILFVRPAFGGILGQYEGDVQVTSPSNGQLLIRDETAGHWENAFLTAGAGISVNNGAGAIVIANTGVTSVTGTAPVVSSGGTTPAISMAAASGSENGYLTSTDWTTFNSKQPAGTYVTTVAATSPVTSTGGTTPTIAMPAATSLVNGYLTSTDWSTFNGKQPAGTYVTSVSATSPVASTGGATPTISMPAATTSVSGYLTNTDWTTFNNKGSVSSVAGTGTVSGLSLSGTVTSSGSLTLNGTLDLSSPPVIGNSSPNSATFTSAALTTGTVSTSPSLNNDIANKAYVDNIAAAGIHYHAPVFVESPNTVGNLTATYNQPGGAGVGVGATLTNAGTQVALTLDGVLMTLGKRVLIYNQTSGFQNGVYTVTNVGSGSTNWVLTRATDADTYAPSSPNSLGQGDGFFVTGGLTGAGETYVCNTVGVITFGVTSITFIQISAAAVYSAGTGLTLSGTEFSITNTGTAATYGSATLIPVITTNAQGQVTSVTTAANPQGTVTAVTGTAPVVSSGGNTPAISMAAATTSVNGYLTSTDWNTFNNKGSGTVTSVAALTLGTTGTDLSSTVATGTTTPVITLQVPTASAANRGALSSADWSTFNGKQSALVSGTSIKTVNSNSLLGSGNVAVQDVLVSGTSIKTINGTSVLGSGDLVVSGSFSGGTLTSPLILAAGTATNGTEPLRFQTGVIAASPAAGTMEYDGVTLMATPQSGNRGVVPAVHYITQVANYTTPLGTANTLKQMFNATTSGSMTASANTTYFFECMFNLSSMSGTSGNFQFGLLGTATITNIMYMAIANKTALTVQTASSHTFGTVRTAVVISANNTTTTGYAMIKGKIVVSTAGTIIPAYATSIAAASVVNNGAHFRIWEAGTNTEVEIGNWV